MKNLEQINSMKLIIKKYQVRLNQTEEVLNTFTKAYESKSDSDWGVIEKPLFRRLSLGYEIEISIYKEIIHDLERTLSKLKYCY